MTKLSVYAAAVVAIFLFGFGAGWHIKTNRVNAAVIKQVVKVAKIDAKNESQVEVQNARDKTLIAKLENDLSAARRAAATRGVPKRADCRHVPEAEAYAGASSAAGAAGKSTGGYEAAYRALRDELLVAGATSEQLRLQVLACQAQWPR